MSHDAGEQVSHVLNSGYIGQGPKVEEFEKLLKNDFKNDYILTVNSCTSALQLAVHLIAPENGFSETDEILVPPLTCLYGQSPILLPEKKTMTIQKMVETKYSGLVVSFNETTQKLEHKKVIGWHKLPIKDKKWVYVSSENSTNVNKNSKKRGVWVTNDHLILTTNGYVFSENLTNDSKLVTTERQLNERQKSFILGSLLGDASVTTSHKKNKNRCRFSVAHSLKQEGWLDLKKEILHEFNHGVSLRKSHKQTGPSKTLQLGFSSIWQEWRNKFYCNNKKIIPMSLTHEDFNEIVLATWYMDDGSLVGNAVVLCTECFEKSEVEFLIALINKKFNILATLQKHKNKYRIYIGNGNNKHDSAKKILKLISPYILPCMRYKLPKKIETEYIYNDNLWNISKTIPYCDKAEIIFDSQPTKPQKYVYCIDVEDNHNFISGGVILHNCFATASAVLANKVKIKWVDIDPKTCNIDLDDLERKIDKNTKGIIVVHWGGTPVDLDRLKSIQTKYKHVYGKDLPIIEDCAHCWDSDYKNTKIGNSGNICCFSFQAIKFLTTGDGGLIVLPNSELYHRAKKLRWFGLDRDAGASFRCIQNISESGFKYHCTDIAATIGICNLPHMANLVQIHKYNALYLRTKLKDVPKITLLEQQPDTDPSYWIFTMLVEDRDKFIKHLEVNGIMASPVHARCDKHTCVKEFASFLPGMDFLQDKHISIPCGWWVTPENIDHIVETIKKGW